MILLTDLEDLGASGVQTPMVGNHYTIIVEYT